MLRLLLTFFLFVFFISCKTKDREEHILLDTDFSWVEINNKYKIKIPKYMEQTKILNKSASLQYMNLKTEEYIIIINEDKQNFIKAYNKLGYYNTTHTTLQNFYEVQLKHLKSAMDIDSLSESYLKNKNTYFTQFSANIKNTGALAKYWVYHISSLNNLYTIMMWTKYENKHIYNKITEQIVNSFQCLEEKTKSI